MGPFDRFNDRAKRVIALAQDEAIRFDHTYIGPEHLLLGLVREGESAAARALDALDVKLSRLRSSIEFLVGRGEATTSPSQIVLDPRTKKIIELAINEAKRLGHSHVGAEHLLLALLREGDSRAIRALEAFGASVDTVRAQVIATIGQTLAPAQDLPFLVAPPATPHVPRPRFGHGRVAMQNVLSLARDEALALGHDWIGTEHFLLALLRPAMPFTMRPLFGLGVTYEKALAGILVEVPRRAASAADPELTPRMYEVLGYAKAYGDLAPGIDGSRAVLVALVANDEGIAAQTLRKLGATPEKILDAMERS